MRAAAAAAAAAAACEQAARAREAARERAVQVHTPGRWGRTVETHSSVKESLRQFWAL